MGGLIAVGLLGGLLLVAIFLAWKFRIVVEPSEVHIVQSQKGTIPYGLAAEAEDEASDEIKALSAKHGNAYYAWPSWWPRIGVQVKVLPLNVFDRPLDDYEAYDVGKVPFIVDVVAFFRIARPRIAAKRMESIGHLMAQLDKILQGAVRTILAQHDIEQIMLDRSTFGELFTSETKDQLEAWGVVNVKNIELMDIRDGYASETISNIMAKKESFIDMESKSEVAKNEKQRDIAIINAQQQTEIRKEEASQIVGERVALKNQQVGIANEQAQQQIKSEAKKTMDRQMDVLQVQTVRAAEIEKEKLIVAAAQDKETMIIKAEGSKQRQITVAEGVLADQNMVAEATLAIGTSTAEAKRLSEMALVEPQISLAQEIGENEGYQSYLISIRKVEKEEVVGVQQAKALQTAEIKVISNTGSVSSGVDNVMGLLSSKGGTEVGAAAEAFAQTDIGSAILGRLGVPNGNGASA